DKDALDAVTATLNKMADGGIYDQIGGGFSRYSTDAYWKVPHFEKMLYDNAQLVSLYSSAYQLTGKPLYKSIVYETLEFIERELTYPEGAFYSSLDADSEGEEGKFYVWKKDELQNVLGNDAPLIMDYYNVTDKGNWENRNSILFKTSSDKKIAENYKITEAELSRRISSAKKIMLKERSKKIRPALDDKILTSWNALMLKGYVDAYRVFDEQKFLDVALKNGAFILKNIKKPDNRLDRNFKNGKSSINGFLDDYAFTIEGFIALYQATFDEKWLEEAQQLSAYTITHFYDSKAGMFYYTSDIDTKLIARKMEITDNVIPAANSVMAKNLFVLGHYFYNDDYINKSKKMLENVKQDALKGGPYYANWDILMSWFVSEPYDVAIVGKDFASKRKEFDRYYLPNVFLSGGKDEGKLSLLEGKFIPEQTTIYVCQNKTCKMPVTEVNKAILLLKNKN
ncbi:MAG: thioredoxin domain-containing protein, partial [Bacteroidetes bacterium]|nr:thioredoxin domain-containing protein [Bacteroidota bacterium]